jgi:threonine/homoserine/homoserine lactone efflux protein
MFETAALASFIGVVFGLFLIPGPAVLLTVTRAAQHGRKAGVLTGIGVASGDFIHTLATAGGLSAVLMTSSLASNVVKFVGAAYLIYLGIRAFLDRPSDPTLPRLSAVSASKAYWQAFGTEILNPKTALFFLAFLPQFVHPERGHALLQFLTLGLIFVVMSVIYTTLLALTVRPLLRHLKRLTWIGPWQGKIVGTLFIGLGVRVALQRQ